MRRQFALFAAIVALTVPASAGAADSPSPALDAIAGQVAGHPTHVFCEDNASEWATMSAVAGLTEAPSGYTYPNGPPVVYIAPRECGYLHELLQPGGADAVGPYWAAGAILTLIHESVHQRHITDEALTDCTALALVPSYAAAFGFPQTTTVTTTTRRRVKRRIHHRTVWRIVTITSTATVYNLAYFELLDWAEAWHKAKPASYQGNC